MRPQPKRVGWRELLEGMQAGTLRLYSHHGQWWAKAGEERCLVPWPAVEALRKRRDITSDGAVGVREWRLG